jgi:GMP synthase-like glutamine amidotransferase
VSERALVLQHEPNAAAGNFGQWAEARGFELEVLMATDDWEVPELDEVAFVASLGSPDHSYDDDLPWLARELDVLAAAHASDTPVYGICFGSQSLARSLGAETRLAEEREVGWYGLTLGAGLQLPVGPWFFWHEDCFDVPTGAELLGSTPRGPALFRTEKDWGVQFHPEIHLESLESWLLSNGRDLDEVTQARMRRNLETEAEQARERAWQLYDAFLADRRR